MDIPIQSPSEFYYAFSLKKSCFFLFAFVIILIVAIGTLALVVFFVLKPQKPIFSLQTVDLDSYKLDVYSNSTLFVSSVVSLCLNAQNPNKVGIKYSRSRLHIFNEDTRIGLIRVPEFYQPAHSTNVSVPTRILFHCVNISQILSGVSVVSSHTLSKIRIVGDIKAHLQVFHITVKVALECDINIDDRSLALNKVKTQFLMKEKETAIKSVMTETRASRFQLCALFILVSSTTSTTTIVSQSVSSSSWPWEEESRSSCDTNNNKAAALFVFGDSLYDPGNNNYITTTNTDFLANFRPYGQSFFPEPTGRFSDGRLIPDFICEYARLPRIPPYLQPGNHQYVYGANFASGGAGALDETYPGLVVNLNTQLNQFENVTYHLKHQLGDKEAVDLLNQSVYMFSIGGNDYLSPTRGDSQQSYTHEQYRSMIIGNLTSVIKAVYKTGGRKFSFVTLPPLGCWPSIKAQIAAGGSKTSNVGDFCNKDLAELVQDHNNAISQNLNKLEKQLKGFMYSIFDLHTTLSDRMNNASKYGFKNGDSACCGSGPYRGVYSCGGMRGIKEYQVCENASEYVFFDSNHPSEAAYQQLANLMWEASFTVTGPHNLRSFFQL